MERLEWILSMAGTCLGLAVTALTFIVKFLRSIKAKRAAERFIKISEALIPYIEEAEKFRHYSGAEKKEYVLTKAKQFAIEKGYEFNAAEISAEIEELVALSKHIFPRQGQVRPNPDPCIDGHIDRHKRYAAQA